MYMCIFLCMYMYICVCQHARMCTHTHTHAHTRSQSVLPDLAPSASPGNLLDVQILVPYLRPTESETLESGAQQSVY